MTLGDIWKITRFIGWVLWECGALVAEVAGDIARRRGGDQLTEGALDVVKLATEAEAIGKRRRRRRAERRGRVRR